MSIWSRVRLSPGLCASAGNLPSGIAERDLEDEFIRFGTLRSVWIARKPPGFGAQRHSPSQLVRLHPSSQLQQLAASHHSALCALGVVNWVA